MKRNDVIVLIPAYKPDEKLLKLLDKLFAEEYSVLIVNDGSGKEYDEIFNSITNATILSHPQNKGKGAALKTGISYIKENTDYKYIITADADGQHTPEDIGKLADFLISSDEKFVIGSRKFTGNVPIKSKYGNKLTIGAYALASGVKIGDTQTGLRGFSKELFDELCQLDGDRYEYEINVLLHVAKRKIKINEIEIETIYIDENASSHFHPFRDSAKIYSCILKYCAAAIVSFVVDFVLAHLFRFCLLPLFITKDVYAIGSLLTFTGENLLSFSSTAFARVLSSILNFFLNKNVVFKSKEKTSSVAIKYFSLVAFSLLLHSALVALLEMLTGLYTLSYVISQIICFIMNYFIQKKFIFKSK